MIRPSVLFALAAALAACGGDDSPGAGGQHPNKPAARARAKPGNKNHLVLRKHVEDNVLCPVPAKPTGPACEPLLGSGAPPAGGKALADCDPGLYCLKVGNGAYSCEACPERDTIRHVFKERDFVADQSRDPFFNYVIMPVGVGDNSNNAKPEPHEACQRSDQFKATNYSYQDLKLVGILAKGAQRKVLMLDTAGHGHIIRRGDCVGKEKAVVKDIGTGYITFVVEQDADSKRPAQETSIQLHPNGLDVEPPPPENAPAVTEPIVAPPASHARGLGARTTPPTPPEPHVQIVQPPAAK